MPLLSHSSDVSGLCGFTAVGVRIGEAKINELPPQRHLGNCAFMCAVGQIVACVLRQYQRYILETATVTIYLRLLSKFRACLHR